MQFDLLKDNLNIEITKQIEENFKDFEKLFKIYNSHTNLISRNDEGVFFEKHIYDSLCLKFFTDKYNITNAKVMDIGTGGGFPALPLAIAFEDFEIHPIDSIAKKIGFIELIQKELRLENIHPLCKRAEDLNPDFRASFDIVTTRAVAPLNVLLEYSIPYLKTGGYFVAYKSRTAKDEIAEAANALKVLNAEVVEEIEYELPNLEDFNRRLIVIKKLKQTHKIYPRKSGIARKNPL